MLYEIENLQKQRQREKGYKLLIRKLSVNYGAKIALIGPSGCGKSTTLDILGLGLQPDSAEKFIFSPAKDNNQKINVYKLWQAGKQDILSDLRLENIGYVLQSGELLPFLTAGENMLLTARLSGMSDADSHGIAIKLASQLGIDHLWDSMPATLSVGERQRAAIVRAIAAHPKVILADEPTAALDPLHADRVMDAFLSVLAEYGSALILVTHNSQWAKKGGFKEIIFELMEDEAGVTAIVDDTRQIR